MERERFQGYVASLEQIMKNTHFDLREAMDQFQELCHRVTTEQKVPLGIVTDIRQTYKEIQDQLTKIRGVNQLLEAKYKQYYRRDSLRDREILEFSFLAKTLYSNFEYRLREKEAKRKLKDTARHFETHRPPISSSWFQSKENQIILLQNLQRLYELGYNTQPNVEADEKREVIQNKRRSISLFIWVGEEPLINNLQSRMRLREYDIKERHKGDELRGALTHLREISPSEVERVMRRFMENSESPILKCLLFSIQSQKDLEKKILSSAQNILQIMGEGEVRTLPIWKLSPQ